MLKSKNQLSVLLILFISLIWGSAFLLIKISINDFSALEIAALRTTLPLLIFLPIYSKSFQSFTVRQKLILVLIGLANNLIPYYLYGVAESQITSAMAGIITSTTPIFTFLFGILLFNLLVEKKKIIGVFLALLGSLIALLIADKNSIAIDSYALLILIAAILYGLSTNLIKVHFNNANPYYVASHIFMGVSIPSIVLLFQQNTFYKVLEYSMEQWLPILILGLVVTGLASILFVHLTQLTTAISTSTIFYLVPIVSVMLGSIYGEPITAYHLFGLLLILLGIYFILSNKKSIP